MIYRNNMAKPKPLEPMIRVNFTVPESLKEEWENFAKDRHISVSQMVRNAVYEYQIKYRQLEQPAKNPELELMEMRLEKLLAEKMEHYIKLFQPVKNEDEIDNIVELKDRILKLLEKFGPQKSPDIADIIGIPRKLLMKVLEEMSQTDKIITVDKGLWGIA